VDTWQSVTLAEELMGVLRAMLSLPQYLMTAMLVGAEHVTHRRESITGAIEAAAVGRSKCCALPVLVRSLQSSGERPPEPSRVGVAWERRSRG